jgi:putative transposon-encoded protein
MSERKPPEELPAGADEDLPPPGRGSVKFEVRGLEVLAKQVKQSGNSGRIYLPPTWVGKRVKIVRVD